MPSGYSGAITITGYLRVRCPLRSRDMKGSQQTVDDYIFQLTPEEQRRVAAGVGRSAAAGRRRPRVGHEETAVRWKYYPAADK